MISSSPTTPVNGTMGGGVAAITGPLTSPNLQNLIERATKRHEWKYPTKPTRLQDSIDIRFIIFNTGEASESIVMEELRGVLDEGTFSTIIKCERIARAGSLPRTDIWVRESAALGISRQIRESTKERTPKLLKALKANLDKGDRHARRLMSTRPVNNWRIARWVQWRDRDQDPRSGAGKIGTKPEAQQCRIATWNINGFHSKKHNIIELLNKKNIVACCLQETLVAKHNYPLRIKGYTTFETPKEEGFRGQAIIVDSRLHSYRIPHAEREILHVKVSGFKENTLNFHLLGVYFPSGAQRRADRSLAWDHLDKISKEIISKDESANVVVCGDFNDPIDKVQTRLELGNLLYLKPATIDPSTRFPRGKQPSAIDHFVCSAHAIRSCVYKPTILKSIKASDHAPMVARLRKVRVSKESPTSENKPHWDRLRIRKNSYTIAHHNRWQTLPVEDLEDEATLEATTDVFNKTLEHVEKELDIRRDGGGYCREQLPKGLKRKLKRYHRALEDYETNAANKVVEGFANRARELRKTRLDFRNAVKFWKRSRAAKKYTRLSEDLLNGDLKQVWDTLNCNIDRQGGSRAVPRILKKDGTWATKEEEVTLEFREHYRALAQDDPNNYRHNERYWQRVLSGINEPVRESLNKDIEWVEVIAAIRRMNRNTAPGSDGVHVNVLKALVMEESMATVKLRGGESYKRLDNVRIDLPLNELINTPLTPMGKQMWRILRSAWNMERFPDSWLECTVISLYKSGDPEDTSNYRGISLMSVLQKVLLQIMQERFGKEASSGNLISAEQTGFRTGEECIGQFITIHEIIRRRHRLEQPTLGVFIDFKKAYDKVHHGALFRACERKGMSGKSLNITKYIYNHTKLRVRIGDTLGEPFDMLRGVRQGCPYSPPLFDVFIDTAWEPKPLKWEGGDQPQGGVLVVGKHKVTRVQAGRYADDIVGLSASSAGLQVMLDDLGNWGNNTEMELGIQKCGVILWGGNEFDREQFNRTKFMTPWGEIPKVEHYKYLGIIVSSNWHKSGSTKLMGLSDAALHVQRMQGKGKKISAIIHPVLRDPYAPILIKVHAIRNILVASIGYGAEWYGCDNKNTDPLDALVSKTCRWVVGAKKSDNSYAGNVLKYELGIPTIREHAAAMRMRLHAKLTFGDRVKTVLGELAKNPPGKGTGEAKTESTWMSGNQKWYKTYIVPTLEKYRLGDENNANEIGYAWPLRESLARARMYETHTRSNNYRSEYIEHINEVLTGVNREGIIIDKIALGVDENLRELGWISTNKTRVGPKYAKERELRFALVSTTRADARSAVAPEEYLVQNVRDSILEKGLASDRTIAGNYYNLFNLVSTRDWIKLTLQRTDLGEGFRWLLSIRTGGFPSVRKQTIRARFASRVITWEDKKCPLCKHPIKERFEWIHLMTECNSQIVVKARDGHLTSIMQRIIEMWRLRPRGVPEEWTTLADSTMGKDTTLRIEKFLTAITLIGGSVPGLWDHDFHYAFGHLGYLTSGLDKPLAVHTAGFLQRVTHEYTARIGIKTGTSVKSPS